jgi:septum formation protein
VTVSRPDIILASESPRRRELLAALGLRFAVRPADVDETPLADERPEELARRLSRIKAHVASENAPGPLVIAADTLVVLDDVVLDKPGSPDEALEILRRLRGRTHQVLTGLTLRRGATGHECTQLARTPVTMRDYGEDELRAYVASGDPMDKAGAYAIQNEAFAPVARLQDCYANVVGLPLCHLYRALVQHGVTMHHPLDVCPWPVQQGRCDWAAAILNGDIA